jgi:RAB protein geranylgeranyltransferase component A
MDASLKETEYDVLLVGTGMVEAILAGYKNHYDNIYCQVLIVN